MKQACIVTYCSWNSFGSILQTIGLKKTLESLGAESFVVKDTPAPTSTKKFNFVFSKSPRKLIKDFFLIRTRKKREVGYKNQVEFINDKVDIIYFNDYEVLKKNPPKADFYIAGSDQIWHPDLCKRLFFLDFVPKKEKCYSYSASMGKTEISEDKKSTFSRLISRFDSISVRESQMENVISEFVKDKVYQHIDPTFLLDKTAWESYEKEYVIDKPYILVFAIYWDKKLNKELKKLHKKTGFEIVSICGGFSHVWATKKIYDADCGNFLYLIHHAKAVVSSSFHGVALSINYNKKICAVVNPKLPSRLNSLLNLLGVKPTKIQNVLDFDLSEYEKINLTIEKEREKSFDYLKGIVNGK